MEILQSISLDFAKKTLPIEVFAKQYDQKTRYIEITPLKFGQKYTIESGVTVRLQLTKPDNTTVITDATINDNIIRAELSHQALAVAGKVTAEIGLYKGETLLSSQVFYIDVEKSAYNADAVKSSNEFNLFIDALNRVEPAVSASEEATKKATDAAAAANTAATAANTAATNASEATEQANEAANLADEAANSANTAADNANAAAERVENAVQAAETATEQTNTASENAQSIADILNEKLNNGEFVGAQGEKGEKGNDGFSPIVSVEPLDNGHKVTITDSTGDKSFDVYNGEKGEQGLPGKDGTDYILTESDKQEIADIAVDNAAEAANNANSATQAAQSVVDLINEKLSNGEFNGADYVLTAADKTEIANLVAPLAESMRSGTVTYEIPKEYHEADFFAFDRNNVSDPNKTGINIVIPYAVFGLAEIVLDVVKFEADLEAGIIEELPEEVYKLPADEQVSIFEEYYKNYMAFSQQPWCPQTIKSWLYYAVSPNQTIMSLQYFFRNDITIRIVIERQDTGEEAIIVSNPSFTQASEIAGLSMYYPVIVASDSADETTGHQTIGFSLMIIGNVPKYASDNRYVTSDDTIKEVTFTFIPNNTFVEADTNE